MKIISNEYIYPLDDLSCHASHFVLLSGGDIFAVWFHGTAEGADDVCIFGAKKTGGKWGEPRQLTPDDGQPHWNPVLHRMPDGKIWLFYKAGKPIAEWRTMVMVSDDECETFTEGRELVPGDVSGGRGPVRNKAIGLSDGCLLAPGSTEEGEWKCFIDRSVDGGASWHRSHDIRIPEEFIAYCEDKTAHGLIQPTLWESSPGHIHALMRSTEGKIFRSDSEDFGVTWSPAYATVLPNNNSGIDVERVGERLYLACNPVGNRRDSVWGRRTPLSILYSDDNGESWDKLTDLATGAGTFAYPALRYADGRLFVTYTWNRKLIMHMCIEL